MDISNIVLMVFMHSIAFGVVCYYLGAQREIGAIGGGLLGLVLGLIGLVIVLLSHKKEAIDFFDRLQKYKNLYDSGTITETEYDHLKGQLFEQR
ncbi:MAG: SHOCT domain-containing protein [Mucilaginibacter sp.]